MRPDSLSPPPKQEKSIPMGLSKLKATSDYQLIQLRNTTISELRQELMKITPSLEKLKNYNNCCPTCRIYYIMKNDQLYDLRTIGRFETLKYVKLDNIRYNKISPFVSKKKIVSDDCNKVSLDYIIDYFKNLDIPELGKPKFKRHWFTGKCSIYYEW